MLWHCWLGDRKGIRPVKSWVLVCWWWRFDWSNPQGFLCGRPLADNGLTGSDLGELKTKADKNKNIMYLSLLSCWCIDVLQDLSPLGPKRQNRMHHTLSLWRLLTWRDSFLNISVVHVLSVLCYRYRFLLFVGIWQNWQRCNGKKQRSSVCCTRNNGLNHTLYFNDHFCMWTWVSQLPP